MRITLSLFCLFFLNQALAQHDSFYGMLDSAKTLFRNAEVAGGGEAVSIYQKAAILFEKTIEIEPWNAEARYFLAYSYSRINSDDGSKMTSLNRSLVLKSSEQLQKVIELSPDYSDEIIAMDPYSKLTSEWGSLAMAYLYHDKPDSAEYAFREGKLRGGFSNFLLEMNRCMLDACSKNAILMSSGDNISIPIWYLQKKENYRPDVRVADINLLAAEWYRAYLRKQNTVSFDLPPQVLDTLDYQEWTAREISIDKFSWLLKPTYEEQFLAAEDQVFLSLLRANKFKRKVYFSMFFPENRMLSLNDHLVKGIVSDKVNAEKKKKPDFAEYVKSAKKYLALSKLLNKNSIDELTMFDGIRYVLLSKVNQLLENNEKEKAKELFSLLESSGSEKEIPYQDDELRKFAAELRRIFL